MKRALILISTATIAIAAESPAPQPADIARDFAKILTRTTSTPKPIGAQFSALCTDATTDKTAGPHSRSFVNYFRSASAMRNDGKFPAGSVIVKEKISADPKTGKPGEPMAVAGMIKRPAGTLPKSGDWEFFWAEGGKLIPAGSQSCAGCHSGAKRDYVFTDAPKPAR